MEERKRNHLDDPDDNYRQGEPKYRQFVQRGGEMSDQHHRRSRPNHRNNGYHRERSAYSRDSASPEGRYGSPYERHQHFDENTHEEDRRSSFYHPQKSDKRRYRHSDGGSFKKRWTSGEGQNFDPRSPNNQSGMHSPSPEQSPSTSPQSLIDSAAKNPREESSNGLQNGSKSSQAPVQSVADDGVNGTEQESRNLQDGPTFVNRHRNTELINIVGKYPHLYDPMDYSARNKAEKEKSWAAISKEFGDTPENCEKGWKLLHSRYRRIEKLMDEGQLSSISEDQIQFKNTINFLPPRRKQAAETHNTRMISLIEQTQAGPSTIPNVHPDQLFANAIMGDLQPFSPVQKMSIKTEIFGVLKKWAIIAENQQG